MNLNYLSIMPLQFTPLWFVGPKFMLKEFAYLLLLLVLMRYIVFFGYAWLRFLSLCVFLDLYSNVFVMQGEGSGLMCWCIQLLSYSIYFQNIQQGRLWTLWSTLIASITGLIFLITLNNMDDPIVTMFHSNLGKGVCYRLKQWRQSIHFKTIFI